MTARACVIGWPITHSRSPLIHGFWLREYGIDGSYTKEAVEPDNLAAFLDSLGEHGFAGCNVTVPHKEAALARADEADETARAIGAANTLWLEGDTLRATNTDVHGFLANLDASAPGWSEGRGTAVVLGAGGAARAVLYGLRERGFADIRLVNRTIERAETLASHFGGVSVHPWTEAGAVLGDCTFLVNTSSLGMTGAPPLDLPLDDLPEQAVVHDIVYAPLTTELLARASSRGNRTVDGLGMLLHQAAPGFQKWFGVRPKVTDALRSLVIADLDGS